MNVLQDTHCVDAYLQQQASSWPGDNPYTEFVNPVGNLETLDMCPASLNYPKMLQDRINKHKRAKRCRISLGKTAWVTD